MKEIGIDYISIQVKGQNAIIFPWLTEKFFTNAVSLIDQTVREPKRCPDLILGDFREISIRILIIYIKRDPKYHVSILIVFGQDETYTIFFRYSEFQATSGVTVSRIT